MKPTPDMQDIGLAAKTPVTTPTMRDHVYKLTELTGTSTSSMEDAVSKAIACAFQNVTSLSWFQVVETRGSIKDGKVDRWQVTLKVGFTVEEPQQTPD